MSLEGWLYFGAGALILGLIVGATLVTRGMRLFVALLIGAGVVVVGWAFADTSGALESKGSEDFGPLFVLLMLAGNFVGWTIGVLLGSIWGMRRSGSIAGAVARDDPADR